MSDMFYVFHCLFRSEECDDFGADCYLCPFYDEEDEDEDEDY